MTSNSHNTLVLALAGVVFACDPCAEVGCHATTAPDSKISQGDPQAREPQSGNLNNPPQTGDLVAIAQEKPSKNDKNKSGGSSGKKSGDDKKSPAASQPSSTWAIILGTYTEDGHEQAARTMIDELRRIAPDIARNSRVHVGSKGSMVLYGSYASRDDANAKDDQERLKKVLYQGRPLFGRVIISRIENRTMNSQFQPNDLLSVRQKYPKVDPLYTIDIAIWDDLGAGKMSYDDIKKKAEAYCTQLRSQGVEAYFYHDDENQRSTVTVGVFDRRAINETSRLFSPEVEAVMKKFPARLVNGEPLNEFKDPYHQSKGGTKPQSPKLVLVPEL